MVTNQPSSSRALWVQEPEVDFDLKLRICRRLLWDSGFDVSAVTVCKLFSFGFTSKHVGRCFTFMFEYICLFLYGSQKVHTRICMWQVSCSV